MAEHSAPDDYERRYMEGDRALLRARQRQALWVPAVTLTALALVVTQFVMVLSFLWRGVGHPRVMAVFVMSAAYLAFFVVATLLGVLVDHVTRVVLTPSHLHVHRGFWSDDIALGSITRVAVEDLSPWSSNASLLALVLGRQRDYASFGVREVLRVEWTDAKGRARTTWVRFEGADAFRAQIEGLRGGATGVRVADDDVAAAGLDDVAADAEAEREARRRG